jgi:hypothetical protein
MLGFEDKKSTGIDASLKRCEIACSSSAPSPVSGGRRFGLSAALARSSNSTPCGWSVGIPPTMGVSSGSCGTGLS